MRKSVFYFLVACLVVLNGYLLARPNLIGKIGLIVYKYYYLRSFPRTLLTVTIVCAIAIGLTELISVLMQRHILGRTIGPVITIIFVLLAFAQLIKTGIDFSTWSYSHTGLRFRLGAFMLPTLMIVIFTYSLLGMKQTHSVEAEEQQGLKA
ncbi:MAG TPA: hypothetical protein VK666_13490 [Chryseolinea sp.]|nr:hypothetical protein [Chryseolinea sp.]